MRSHPCGARPPSPQHGVICKKDVLLHVPIGVQRAHLLRLEALERLGGAGHVLEREQPLVRRRGVDGLQRVTVELLGADDSLPRAARKAIASCLTTIKQKLGNTYVPAALGPHSRG